jgi:excinuclease ABC subunit B
MVIAAGNLEYERAALLRDQIVELKTGTGISRIEPKRRPVSYSGKKGRR